MTVQRLMKTFTGRPSSAVGKNRKKLKNGIERSFPMKLGMQQLGEKTKKMTNQCGLEKICGRKKNLSEKMFGRKHFWSKNVWSKKCLVQKNVGPKKVFGRKNFLSRKNVGAKKKFGAKQIQKTYRIE